MYRQNDKHQQQPLFSSLDDLPDKQRRRLETSWAGTFYEEVFCRIDESLFEALYSDKASRPNTPINVLVSTEIMKAGFGWSDAELEEQMAFNLQARYAVGYRDLTEGHFELRTVYNFRQKMTAHMQETGENLLERVFEQVTDEQSEALTLKTGKLRMDSLQIGSNIRQMSRLQLLVEVTQRTWRMLSEVDQARYKADFEAYMKGTAGQVIYHLEPGEAQSQLESIGYLMQRLVTELETVYGENATYAVLARVYSEHFVIEEQQLRPKIGKELSAQSLQSADDWEATYREKKGIGYQGYVTNITETCDPDNPAQLIVKVQTEVNSTDDAQMLVDAVPDLVTRTDVDELYTDGGFNSADADEILNAEQIELYQSAIRGRKTHDGRLGLADFEFELQPDGRPDLVICPAETQADVHPGRKAARFTARFDADTCAGCPLLKQCPTKPLKRNRGRVLRFTQQDFHVARRRQNQKQAKADRRNLRSAVEATVRSVKHPFGNGKLPVRGKPRVSMMMIASAAMTNARRIWRYRTLKNADENSQIATENDLKPPVNFVIRSFLRPFFCFFAVQAPHSLHSLRTA